MVLNHNCLVLSGILWSCMLLRAKIYFSLPISLSFVDPSALISLSPSPSFSPKQNTHTLLPSLSISFPKRLMPEQRCPHTHGMLHEQWRAFSASTEPSSHNYDTHLKLILKCTMWHSVMYAVYMEWP